MPVMFKMSVIFNIDSAEFKGFIFQDFKSKVTL